VSGEDDELVSLEAELADLERRVRSRVEPGSATTGVLVGILLLIASVGLPWTGDTAGWEVIAGRASLGALPPLFALTAFGFGVVGSVVALVVRRWGVAWMCAVGCGFSVLGGVWAIWSRQITVPHGGEAAGFGLVLALVGVVVLTFGWVRIVLHH